jgi:PAS domain S-box-containing protein
MTEARATESPATEASASPTQVTAAQATPDRTPIDRPPIERTPIDRPPTEPTRATTVDILLLEDSAIDADLLESHLLRSGFRFRLRRATGRQSYMDAIEAGGFDIILADYSLPDFDGLTALRVARARYPEVPFIFVSGVVGEEFATDALKQGAVDYVLKRNLMRLPAAVDRALAEARERQERRRAETALLESDVRLRLAISSAKLGTWDYAPDRDEVVWRTGGRTDAGEKRTTYEAFMAGVHPIDRARMEPAMRLAMTPGNPGSFAAEYRMQQRDGSVRWMAARGQSFFHAGRCTRFVGVIQDITDQKAAEVTLRRQNRLLAREVRDRTRERDRIWQLSRDLMVVCDFATRPVAVNPAWTQVLGWTEAELLGRAAIKLFHPEDKARLRRDKPPGANAMMRVECRLRRKKGSYRWIAWTAVSQDDLIYAIGRDVTEEKVATQEVAAANRQLVRQIEEREKVETTLRQMQRLEAVGQLTSGVAHDFNNLLTVILGNVAFLQRDMADMDPKLLRRLDQMAKAAERGAKLTGQLLAFSRRQRLEPKPVDLNETVLGMRDLLQSTMGGSVHIKTLLEAELWAALVDPTQIELIILNLAINARDAMEVGGDLIVSTGNTVLSDPPSRPEEPPPGEYVMLSVTDTGTGMSQEVLQRAFEPFFTTKEVGKGSGLGLAQVFGFAKQSGGGVRIETALGVGTSIHVLLPRAQVTTASEPAGKLPEAAVPAASVDNTRPNSGTLILLVDDDGAVREITAKMLRDLGYDVIEAGSGGAALDLLAREPRIALSVLDYAMPGMSGAEVAQEAHKRRPGLPVVFITGYADLTALKGVGEHQVVQKPFRETDLADKVGRSLRQAYG